VRAAIAGLILLLAAMPAEAGLTRAQLASVDAAPPAGARLDLHFATRDATGTWRSLQHILNGRPAFVTFVDYTCTTLCGTDLELLSQAILSSRLVPSQYRILVIGIDPKDKAGDALAMERKEIPPALRPATILLLPDKTAIRNATAALGFRSIYDPPSDQFAHPAIIYVIGPDGVLRTRFSPFSPAMANLRQVLATDAPAGLLGRIRLLCYAYDPATGIYNLRVGILLKIASALTVLAVFGAVFLLRRARRLA